jgi:hypothetical protein
MHVNQSESSWPSRCPDLLKALHHPDIPLTRKQEEKALCLCAAARDPKVTMQFLASWSAALQAYGQGSFELVDGMHYQLETISVRGHATPIMMRYDAERVLDSRAAKIGKQAPYVARQPIEQYGLRIEPACVLCQNNLQALDAADNVILDLGSHFLLPNRYPRDLGLSLFLSKEHDDHACRCELGRAEVSVLGLDTKKRTVCLPEPGKTRGRIPEVKELLLLMNVCDIFDLIAFRNHPLSAMSVPAHDHFQLYPAGLDKAACLRAVLNSADNLTQRAVYSELAGTLFSTLSIRGRCREETAWAARAAIMHLEEGGEVYTVLYRDGRFMISPRRAAQRIDVNIEMGGSRPLVNIDHAHFEVERGQIENFCPLRGQFDWEPYRGGYSE